jgi:hypothetical protein
MAHLEAVAPGQDLGYPPAVGHPLAAEAEVFQA